LSILEVEKVRDIDVQNHDMNLAVLNKGRTNEKLKGPEIPSPLYTAMASAFTTRTLRTSHRWVALSVEELALPGEMAEATNTGHRTRPPKDQLNPSRVSRPTAFQHA
jgi:hypothetical protein